MPVISDLLIANSKPFKGVWFTETMSAGLHILKHMDKWYCACKAILYPTRESQGMRKKRCYLFCVTNSVPGLLTFPFCVIFIVPSQGKERESLALVNQLLCADLMIRPMPCFSLHLSSLIQVELESPRCWPSRVFRCVLLPRTNSLTVTVNAANDDFSWT